MKRKAFFARVLLAVLASTQVYAVTKIQRIDVVNLLWNQNGTSGIPGLTPTSVVVAFNNGGAKPCYTNTLSFQGATTVLAGTGQVCIAAVTSISVTPVAGPAGTVYAAPSNFAITGSYFATQIIINQLTAPTFDSTNGSVVTQGTVQATIQGQFKND